MTLHRNSSATNTARHRVVAHPPSPIPHGSVKLDADGRICAADAQAEAFLGKRRAQLLGKRLAMFVSGRDRPLVREQLRRARDAAGASNTTVRLTGGRRVMIFCAARRKPGSPPQVTALLYRAEQKLHRMVEAVHEGEDRLQLMADSLPVLISYVDRQQRYRFNNAQYEQWFARPREYFLGRTVRQVVGARAYAHIKEDIEAALAGDARSFETTVPYANAGLRYVHLDYVPHRDTHGNVMGFFALIRDVSDRKLAEEQLRRSEKNLAKAQQMAHVGSYEYRIGSPPQVHWSKEMFRILGVRRSVPLTPQEYFARIVHPDDVQRVMDSRRASIRRRMPIDVQYRILLPDGSIRHVHSIGEPEYDSRGRFTKMVGLLMDISDRKRLEQEVLETSESEQRRIAQDLHDGLGQCLAGICHLASTLQRNLVDRCPEFRTDAARILTLLREAVQQTRTLARGLYPVKDEPNGLMLALEQLAARTRDIFSVHCRFHCLREVLVNNNSVATHLYRIAQEAVNNAIRHGRARHITITLRRLRRNAILTIKDDGLPFSDTGPSAQGMGIRIMRYRAGSISGAFSIASRGRRGTAVTCRFPFNHDKQEPRNAR